VSPELLEIDQALAIILEHATPLAVEDVRAADADGRFLAAAVTAAIDLPPFTNSAMDGYALRAADTPGTLELEGESAAGRPYDATVLPGQTVAISTGAVLPSGADAVVPLELVQTGNAAESGIDTVTVPDEVALDNAIRHRGSDITAGARIIAAGVRIGPAQIGAAIAAGVATLSCGRRPRVAVLATGDELRPVGEPLAPGEIYDSNGPMLAAALKRAGATVTSIAAAADTPQAHRDALGEALEHDVVISTGGVSVGPHDLVRGIGAELGVKELFWRIKMRPGKPLSFGVRDRGTGPDAQRTLVFGLPGNPVSTLVCYELFVVPALAALQSAAEPRPRFTRAKLAVPVRQYGERDDLIRVTRNAAGELEPVRGQQSHQISITALADGLARIPTGTGELPAGSEVAYLPLYGH
jgi:molybdopterin molybdotransferase